GVMRSLAAKPNIRMAEKEEKPALGAPPADPKRVVGRAAGCRDRRQRDAVKARLEDETRLLPRERSRSYRFREQHFDISARRLWWGGRRRVSGSKSRPQTALAREGIERPPPRVEQQVGGDPGRAP